MTESLAFTTSSIGIDAAPIADHVYIIGEIGINHNGSVPLAKELIQLAKSAGCDAVKFQKRTVDVVYSRDYLASSRQSPWGSTQGEQKRGLELSLDDYREIDEYCSGLGIEWFSSSWDVESQEAMRQFDLPYNKVASAMLTHVPLLEAVASEGKPTFISTGMSDWTQVDKAVEVFSNAECPFVLMHCVSVYPADENQLNLKMIQTLRSRYGCPVGYSGHEASVSPSVAAVLLGAVAIERHITLDRAMYGSDQAASLEPAGLKTLVAQIRKIPLVLGDGQTRPSPGEEEVAQKLRYWHPDEFSTPDAAT